MEFCHGTYSSESDTTDVEFLSGIMEYFAARDLGEMRTFFVGLITLRSQPGEYSKTHGSVTPVEMLALNALQTVNVPLSATAVRNVSGWTRYTRTIAPNSMTLAIQCISNYVCLPRYICN